MVANILCLFIEIICSMINPILGFIINLITIKIKKITKFDIILIAFNLSLIIVYLPLMADVKYNFEIKNFLSQGYINNYNKIPIKFTYHKIILLLEKINLTYMEVFMFYVFCTIVFCLGTYYILDKKKKDKIYVYIYIFYLSVLCNISGFNRFNLSIIIVNFAIFFDKKIIKNILFVISFLLHQGIVILLPLYILAKFMKTSILKKRLLLTLLTIVVFNSILYEIVIKYILISLKPIFSDYYLIQLNYFISNEAFYKFSFRIFIKKFFEVGIPCLMGVYFAKNAKIENKNEENLFYLTLILQCFLVRLNTISERLSLFSYVFMISIYLKNKITYSNKNISKTLLVLLFVRFIVYNFIVYGYVFLSDGRDQINNKVVQNRKIEELFTKNTMFLIDNMKDIKERI